MQRFFVPPEWIQASGIRITGPLVHQMRNVLRLRPGHRVILLDNSGWEYEVELKTVAREAIEAEVKGKSLASGEPRTKITLYQALLKGRNFELVLQKGTELGVAAFVPMICQRCIVASLDDGEGAKVARWQKVILEAAEQSHRGKLPHLHPVMLFPEACRTARGISLLPWEGERERGIRSVLRPQTTQEGIPDPTLRPHAPFSINLFIGPEGGFTPEEVALAQSYGVLPVTLGSRILRAETAGLVAAAAILCEWGDLGG